MRKSQIFIKIFLALLVTFWTFSTSAYEIMRRREQFVTTPGYLLVPAPWVIPGIGSGIMGIGYAGNIGGTTADLNAIAFLGDADGFFLRANEMFIVPDYLFLEIVQGEANKFGQNIYSSRGMKSEADEYNVFISDEGSFFNYAATLTLWERRINLTARRRGFSSKTVEIRDNEGETISDLKDNPIEFSQNSNVYEVLLDFTDDFYDPLEGIRIEGFHEQFERIDSNSARFNTDTLQVTAFIPMLERSTWAFHYMQSSATVINEGNVDLNSLRSQNGFNSCSNSGNQTACEQSATEAAQNQFNANKNGTARGLGGVERLRSYPINRYVGAHSRLYGTEFRWNIAHESKVFDYAVVSDVNQATQIAFFWEQGSVSEQKEKLNDEVRTTYGAGYRLVTGSGNVYRFDFATGDEGPQLNIFFQYPWGNLSDSFL